MPDNFGTWAISLARVAVDAPLTSELGTDYKMRDELVYSLAFFHDGSKPATGNWDMAGFDIDFGGGNIVSLASLSAFSIAATNLTATNLTANTINVVDIDISGNLTGQNQLVSAGLVSYTGTNVTAGIGIIRDNAHGGEDVDFTSHLGGPLHFVFIPSISNAACYFINNVVDSDNIDMADSSSEAKNSVDFGTGNDFWIIDADTQSTGPRTITGGSWWEAKQYSWLFADISSRTLSVNGAQMGGKKRTLMLIYYESGADAMTANYGDKTLTMGVGGDDGVVMFVVLPGDNTLTITKLGTGVASANVHFDHVQTFVGGLS